jgi:hypothetical protein
VRRLPGEVALDPDEQVQAVIRLIFELFDRLGTVNAVLCFLADNHIQLGVRLREGPERGELSWRRPSRAGVQNILRNPAYAGVYAYGRSRVDPRRRRAGRPFTGRVRTAREEWIVFLPGLLPAYISTGQYEKNKQRMDANRSRSQSLGAVRDGPALLAGLAACGRCGEKITVHYQRGPGGRQQPVYVCARAKSDYGAGQCQQITGSCVDAHVTGLLLAAMAPAALEVSLAAAEQGTAQRAQVDRIWRQRLERADFAADRARRQYQLAEPENRLVVRQLEKDWEAALAERQRLGEEYDRFTAARPRTLTAAEREQIRALAADLPAVWNAPTHHQRRPQAADPPPDRAGPHHGARCQRESGHPGGMGGRAPHGHADHPPSGLPDPAQLLPSAGRLGPGARRQRMHHRADRRAPQRRGLPSAQAHPRLHPHRGPPPGAGNCRGGRVLGATIVAARAGEMIHEPALAIRTAMFTGRLAQATHAYLTWSLAIQQAAAQFFGEFGGRTARDART